MTKQTSFRLPPETRKLLAALAREWGMTQTAVLIVLIRLEAERKGIQGERKDSDHDDHPDHE